MTVAFGHGIAVTPLQSAVADAALVNGGKLIPPTFLPRTQEEADKLAEQVVKPETSDELRYLFRLNVEKGSGTTADGARLPASAARPAPPRRSTTAAIPTTSASTPSSPPSRWTIRNMSCWSCSTSRSRRSRVRPRPPALNAAPTVAAIIRRSAALLGVKPASSTGDGLPSWCRIEVRAIEGQP